MACGLKVGMTGGIGSGKSEASRYLSTLGAGIIDTDLIARELVEPGQPALQEISATLGPQLLQDDGSLDRPALRQLVFSSDSKRRQLEDILHPRILQQSMKQAALSQAVYCIVVVPLLVETGLQYPVDRVLVIDCPEELQYQRVHLRDDLPAEQVGDILQVQAERGKRLAVADDVIVNDGDIETLHHRLDQLHEKYIRLATGTARTGDRRDGEQ